MKVIYMRIFLDVFAARMHRRFEQQHRKTLIRDMQHSSKGCKLSVATLQSFRDCVMEV